MTQQKLLDTLEFPVRWGDLDMYGHLNNTVYFKIYEEARVHWLETDPEGLKSSSNSVI